MKIQVKIAVVILLVIVLPAVIGVSRYYGTVDLGDQKVPVVIQSGDYFVDVASRLKASGVIESETILRLAARVRGIDRKLTPGRYDFVGENSVQSVLDRLEHADFLRVKVTVPEGAPIWEVASILAEQMATDSAELIALNIDSTFLDSLEVVALEGYLFPETYFFPWGTDLRLIVRDMVTMFRSQTDPIWTGSVPNSLSREEVVVLASIVQAEATFDDEMPTIASVYHNRLDRRMKLDADPTVIYGLGGLDRPLYSRDLRKPGPYNTYLNKGLPPTAINSPGVAAIKAVLDPATTEYFFFVADGTGKHRFSRTNAEHNRARREISRGTK